MCTGCVPSLGIELGAAAAIDIAPAAAAAAVAAAAGGGQKTAPQDRLRVQSSTTPPLVDRASQPQAASTEQVCPWVNHNRTAGHTTTSCRGRDLAAAAVEGRATIIGVQIVTAKRLCDQREPKRRSLARSRLSTRHNVTELERWGSRASAPVWDENIRPV